jgi:16S rRNA (cytidine1402-2'-O)-methyltransferase
MENEPGILYIVATPIGNLSDMTFRAVDILSKVDLIACEDTRVTKRLLQHYDIDTQTTSYHQHTKNDKVQKIIAGIIDGDDVAVVTDAGTPGISDPGNVLVAAAIKESVTIMPIPGCTALTTLVSVAGIDMQQFTFLAYPPHKKGRQTFFRRVVNSEMPVVYYDSVHRVVKNLELLKEISGGRHNVIIGRELTKMHEQIIRGTVEDSINYFAEHPDKVRGEFVIIVYTQQ